MFADGKAKFDVGRLIKKNLLLIGIGLALILALLFPAPGVVIAKLDLTGALVALIFFGQGMTIDLKELRRLRKFLKVIGWGALVSLALYPALAYAAATLFSLSRDALVGFVLVCSAPCTLAAGSVIVNRVGGDLLTAAVLMISLNLLGLFAFPENLKVWLGSAEEISAVSLILKLALYLFLPVMLGQVVNALAPALVRRSEAAVGFLPPVNLSIILYASFSKESALMRGLGVLEVVVLLALALSVHLVVLGTSFLGGKHLLRLRGPSNRATAIICSEKPLTLAVAVWAMDFSRRYPMAILPIVALYIVQIFTDSVWGKKLIGKKRKD